MGSAAKKICKLDHKEILEILQQAYAEEWLAYYQYWIGAQVIFGPMRVTIKEEFEKHAKEELEHAEKVATRIIQLGEEPLLSPFEWDKYAGCKYEIPSNGLSFELLKQNLASERCAINRYQQICEMCFGKDYETYDISAQILHDELDHEQDWEDFIKDLECSRQFCLKS